MQKLPPLGQLYSKTLRYTLRSPDDLPKTLPHRHPDLVNHSDKPTFGEYSFLSPELRSKPIPPPLIVSF